MQLSPRWQTSILMLAFLLSLMGLINLLLDPAQAVRHWQAAPGHVESSRIMVSSPEGHPDQTRWEPYVQYLYTVNGEVYHGDQLYAVATALPGDHSSAEDLTRRFPTGKAVVVYYNPQEPSRSVLIREGDSSIGSGRFILAALSTLFGWALCDRLLQRWRHVRRLRAGAHG